jgi:hypothetical protein
MNFLDCVLLQKLLPHRCEMRSSLLRLDGQFPIRLSRLNCAPISQWTQNIGYVMARVGLAPIEKNIDEVKAAGIPNCREPQFCD